MKQKCMFVSFRPTWIVFWWRSHWLILQEDLHCAVLSDIQCFSITSHKHFVITNILWSHKHLDSLCVTTSQHDLLQWNWKFVISTSWHHLCTQWVDLSAATSLLSGELIWESLAPTWDIVCLSVQSISILLIACTRSCGFFFSVKALFLQKRF